ncbi:MAG: hypothetical protein R3C14_22755 [Caldilineaceae bacterium]
MTLDETVAKAAALSAEIDELHRGCMDRLNALGWQTQDMLMLSELIGEDAAVLMAQAQPTDNRLRRARAMLAGATDATSKKLAKRVIVDWLTPEAEETETTAVQSMARTMQRQAA